MLRKHAGIAVVAGIALAFTGGLVVGQNVPAENKGVKVSAPTALDLGKEVDSVDGRQLRMRVVTIEPGGAVAMHSHKGRPAVAYALQGTLTEHLESGEVRDHAQGEAWTEDHTVTHWAENKTDQPVMVLAVDVFKP
jgi:quercetin dioxygenase-like cupin family protein